MSPYRIALANLRFPSTPDESVALAQQAIQQAAQAQAHIVCLPECYTPGLRGVGQPVAPPDATFLDQAHDTIAQSAARSSITVILGTERLVDGASRKPNAAVSAFTQPPADEARLAPPLLEMRRQKSRPIGTTRAHGKVSSKAPQG